MPFTKSALGVTGRNLFQGLNKVPVESGMRLAAAKAQKRLSL